ncbi:ATP-binding protein [Oleidesulfovibrio sp.]|uniref:ATP-binding protein n=1 Tax=Oleidesulfovibrio sp. TaxID=2909707 RepID=UPI003A8588A9
MWPESPIIFCGVNNYRPQDMQTVTNYTGVVESPSPLTTVQTILKLQPEIEEIFIINDYLTTGRAWVSFIDKELEPLKGKVRFIWNDNLSLDELRKKISTMQPNQAVMIGVYFSDKDGKFYTYERMGELLTEVSPVPVYSLLEFYVGHGSVGGDVISGFAQGKQAAELAKRIITGTPADSIPVMRAGANRYVFDWNVLQKFGLKADRLPADTVMLNKPQTFYAKHKYQVWFGALGVVALLLLIILQRWHIARQNIIQLELKKSKNKYHQLVEHARSIIMQIDTHGVIQFMNEYGLSFFGWNADELIGKNMIGTIITREYMTEQELLGIIDEIEKAPNQTRSNVRPAIRRSGEVVWIAWSSQALFNDKGKFAGLLSVGQDDTGRKIALDELEQLNLDLEQRVQSRTAELQLSLDELKAAQAQLVESEKMASLGGLVAGVAHEINTPLGLGLTSVSYMEEQLDMLNEKLQSNTMKKSDLTRFFDISKESITSSMINLRRAAELIQSFKQVAVDQTTEHPRRLNLREYLNEVMMSLRSSWRHTSHTVAVVGSQSVTVYCYPGAVMQVVSNLVTNALIHGLSESESGNIIVSIEQDDTDAILIVKDDGKGMPPEVRDRAFEPFFSTRKGQGGTGLGLHIVFNIVSQKLGGTIECISEPGKGTTFTIRFPKQI